MKLCSCVVSHGRFLLRYKGGRDEKAKYTITKTEHGPRGAKKKIIKMAQTTV